MWSMTFFLRLRNLISRCSCKVMQNFGTPVFLFHLWLPSKPSGGRATLVQQVRASQAVRDSCRRSHLFRTNIPDLSLSFLTLVYGADSKHLASTERYNFINSSKWAVFICVLYQQDCNASASKLTSFSENHVEGEVIKFRDLCIRMCITIMQQNVTTYFCTL
jgi:hypothetical protein